MFVCATAGCAGQVQQFGVACRRGGPAPVVEEFDHASERALRVRRISRGTRPVLILVGMTYDRHALESSVIREVVETEFDYEFVVVAGPYDEMEDRREVSERVRSGDWDVCLDQYLHMRDDWPLSRADIEVLRRLGVIQTPTLFVFRADGVLLGLLQGSQLDNEREILRALAHGAGSASVVPGD